MIGRYALLPPVGGLYHFRPPDASLEDRSKLVPFQQIMIALGALSGVMMLIWAGQRLLRSSMFRAPSTGRLRVLQMVALDPRRRVVLLQCDGAELLLLTGGPSDLLLSKPLEFAVRASAP